MLSQFLLHPTNLQAYSNNSPIIPKLPSLDVCSHRLTLSSPFQQSSPLLDHQHLTSRFLQIFLITVFDQITFSKIPFHHICSSLKKRYLPETLIFNSTRTFKPIGQRESHARVSSFLVQNPGACIFEKLSKVILRETSAENHCQIKPNSFSLIVNQLALQMGILFNISQTSFIRITWRYLFNPFFWLCFRKANSLRDEPGRWHANQMLQAILKFRNSGSWLQSIQQHLKF